MFRFYNPCVLHTEKTTPEALLFTLWNLEEGFEASLPVQIKSNQMSSVMRPSLDYEWLDDLGSTRAERNMTTIRRLENGVLLTCAAPLAPDDPAEKVLLEELLNSPNEPGGLFQNDIKMELVESPEQSTICIKFTGSGPSIDAAALETAAALFEPFFQFHLKATKSELHRRMRLQLTELQSALDAAHLPPKSN
jgi:hypothetical protein